VKSTNFFTNKVVVITGASSGIGKELAMSLSNLGGKLVLAARNEVNLADVKREIEANGNEAIAVKTDIAVEQDVINLVNTTLDTWGKIDIFIANAAQYIQRPLKDIVIEEFRDSFEVNFFGSLYAVKQILPIMIKQYAGHIVFINSLDAKKGIVGDAPYVAAKSALDGLADVLRQEVKESGIKITTVYPGRVDTPMIQDIEVPRISAKISSKKVADAVITGIYKNKPIIVVPKMCYVFGALNNLSPRLMDWFYKMFRLEGRKIE